MTGWTMTLSFELELELEYFPQFLSGWRVRWLHIHSGILVWLDLGALCLPNETVDPADPSDSKPRLDSWLNEIGPKRSIYVLSIFYSANRFALSIPRMTHSQPHKTANLYELMAS